MMSDNNKIDIIISSVNFSDSVYKAILLNKLEQHFNNSSVELSDDDLLDVAGGITDTDYETDIYFLDEL